MRSKNTFKKTYHNFYERQRYKNNFLLILAILVEALFLVLITREILADNLWGSKSRNTWMLIGFTLLVPTPLLLSFYFVRLDTIVTHEGIFYRWAPFRKGYNMVLWDNVKEVFIVDMKQVGFRWRFTNPYNETNFPGSDHALLVHLKNGKKKLIGTRKGDEMNRALLRNSGGRYHSTFVEKYDLD